MVTLMKRLLLLLLLFPYLCPAQIPEYYSTIDFTQTGNNLKHQLTTLITNTHTTFLPYTASGTIDTWDALSLTDLNPNNTNNVLLIYGWNDSDTDLTNDYSRDKNLSCHTSSCSGLWSREHVFPRSLGTPNLGFEFAGSDAHNLRAIDANRNETRSNLMYEAAPSNVMSYVTPYGNWYPGDEWRGDVARIIMYMYVRYTTQCAPNVVGAGINTYSTDMPDVFLLWNCQDPVSQYEINRNNILNDLQGNRNPFIDNPYLATIIWNGPQATNTWEELSINNMPFSNLVLYPTVTQGIIHISSNNPNYTYQVHNAVGQLVKSGNTSETIDISNNPKGVYLVKVQANNLSKTYKIILN